jgi:hypothetical protein
MGGAQEMNSRRPEKTTLETLVALGQCADGDARIGELLTEERPVAQAGE